MSEQTENKSTKPDDIGSQMLEVLESIYRELIEKHKRRYSWRRYAKKHGLKKSMLSHRAPAHLRYQLRKITARRG